MAPVPRRDPLGGRQSHLPRRPRQGAFPYFFRNKRVQLTNVRLLIRVDEAFRTSHGVGTLRTSVKVGADAAPTPTLAVDADSGLPEAVAPLRTTAVPPGVPLTLDALIVEVGVWLQGTAASAARTPVDPRALSEVWLIAHAVLG